MSKRFDAFFVSNFYQLWFIPGLKKQDDDTEAIAQSEGREGKAKRFVFPRDIKDSVKHVFFCFFH